MEVPQVGSTTQGSVREEHVPTETKRPLATGGRWRPVVDPPCPPLFVWPMSQMNHSIIFYHIVSLYCKAARLNQVLFTNTHLYKFRSICQRRTPELSVPSVSSIAVGWSFAETEVGSMLTSHHVHKHHKENRIQKEQRKRSKEFVFFDGAPL